MSEYIYSSNGEPLANERGEILLARAGEIVRCKDCTYISDDGLTTAWCSENCREVKPDGFCAWGERREGE